MKKLIAMLLALVMVLGLVACGASEPAATEAAPAATEAPAAPEAPAPAAPAETKPEDITVQELGLYMAGSKRRTAE